MQKVTFLKSFDYSPNGFDVEQYKPGEHEVSEDCAAIALKLGLLDSDKTYDEAGNKGGNEEASSEQGPDRTQSADVETTDSSNTANEAEEVSAEQELDNEAIDSSDKVVETEEVSTVKKTSQTSGANKTKKKRTRKQ